MAEILRRAIRGWIVDPCALTAAGILFYAKSTGRRLFLMRAARKYRGTWGLVGGKIEDGETLLEGMLRETTEEIGFVPEISKMLPVEKFTSPDGRFEFHTFIFVTAAEFTPELNHEHIGYCWLDAGMWPAPLHPGLYSSVQLSEIKDKLAQIEKNFIQYRIQK